MIYIVLILMTMLGASASVFLKKASAKSDLLSVIKSPAIYTGGILYLTAALLNIYVLSKLDYSKVLPLTSVTYVWTMAFSYMFFNERINLKKASGVLLIILGAVLITF